MSSSVMPVGLDHPSSAPESPAAGVPPHDAWDPSLKRYVVREMLRRSRNPYGSLQMWWERELAFALAGTQVGGTLYSQATSPADAFPVMSRRASAWSQAGEPLDLEKPTAHIRKKS